MKTLQNLSVAFILVVICTPGFSTKRIVDINGGGQFTTIQSGINAAVAGDTVIVWPGNYYEQITLNKAIALQGSGYENTQIIGISGTTIMMSNGILRWFMVTATTGTGVFFTGGLISNCVIKGCADYGILASTNSITARISNCVITQNGSTGIHKGGNGMTYVLNCISKSNGGYGYQADAGNPYFNLSFSCGSRGSYVGNTQGCFDADPLFISATDYHLITGSPCSNTGQPVLLDHNGTRSDMGYFGGPDAPIYPVVYEMTTAPNNNNINVNAKVRANY